MAFTADLLKSSHPLPHLVALVRWLPDKPHSRHHVPTITQRVKHPTPNIACERPNTQHPASRRASSGSEGKWTTNTAGPSLGLAVATAPCKSPHRAHGREKERKLGSRVQIPRIYSMDGAQPRAARGLTQSLSQTSTSTGLAPDPRKAGLGACADAHMAGETLLVGRLRVGFEGRGWPGVRFEVSKFRRWESGFDVGDEAT